MEGLDFAGELRRLMDESGISLRKLASRIPVDPGHLSRVANGKRPPGVELAKRCDEILGSGRTLRQAAEAATHAASGQSAVGGVADPLTVCVPVMRNGRAQLMALDRRTLLKGAAAGAAAMATGAPAWTTRSQHLAPEAADHLIDLRATLVRSDSLLGPNRLIVTVAEQLTTVQGLLGLARGGLRTRMFEIAALFAEFQGWLQDDIGSAVTGSAWTSQALDWAEVSGDDSLTAYMLMRRAQQAAARGDAAVTIGPAAAARRRRGASSWVKAAAAQQEGHGHALDGDDVSALDSFDEALELVSSTADPVGDYELASWCTPDYVHAQRGAALIQLKQYSSAVAAFDEALSAWPREYRRERGLHLARKAYALAAGRRTDEALDVGTGALRIGLETGSRRTIEELVRTAHTLHSFGPSKDFDQFSDAVEFAAREGQAS